MQKLISILFFTVISISATAQINFKEGYFVANDGTVTSCLIEDVEWKNNPEIFEYKLEENSGVQIGRIESIQEFGIDNELKYKRFNIMMDRSGDYNNLSDVREPIFENETRFLKVIIEGKATLYYYIEGNLKRFFIETDSKPIEQLVYKKYKYKDVSEQYKKYGVEQGDIGVNNTYKQQLSNSLSCSELTPEKFQSVKYTKGSLLKAFKTYNECVESAYVCYEKEKEDTKINVILRPGVSYSSLVVSSPPMSIYNNVYGADFGSQVTWRLGVEAEYILPFNKNKWRVIVEPTYQYFTGGGNQQKVWRDRDSVTVKYNTIDFPVGIRYNTFLNDKISVFANISGVLVFDFKSSKLDYADANDMEISSNTHLAFGVGVNFNDRISTEFRYHTKRSILSEFYWDTDYNTMQFIVGYTILNTGK